METDRQTNRLKNICIAKFILTQNIFLHHLTLFKTIFNTNLLDLKMACVYLSVLLTHFQRSQTYWETWLAWHGTSPSPQHYGTPASGWGNAYAHPPSEAPWLEIVRNISYGDDMILESSFKIRVCVCVCVQEMLVKISFLNHSISRYLYNALEIQPQKLVQITSNSYAAELQKKWNKNLPKCSRNTNW